VAADNADDGKGGANQRGHCQTAKSPRFGPGFLHGGQGNGGGERLGRDRGGRRTTGLGNGQGLPARWTGDLAANVTGVAKDFLAATGAIEFKIAHGIKRPSSSFGA
jgi:hypothetical protein